MSERAHRAHRKEKRRESPEEPETDQFVDDWSEHVLDKIVQCVDAGQICNLKSDLRSHVRKLLKHAKAQQDARLRPGDPDLSFHQLLQSNLDQPRQQDETSSVYARRKAVKRRHEKHDERSSVPRSKDPRDLGTARTFREKVSIQRIRNQDLRESGSSKFPDQGIEFDEDRRPYEPRKKTPVAENHRHSSECQHGRKPPSDDDSSDSSEDSRSTANNRPNGKRNRSPTTTSSDEMSDRHARHPNKRDDPSDSSDSSDDESDYHPRHRLRGKLEGHRRKSQYL
jgi:hypothetical protein